MSKMYTPVCLLPAALSAITVDATETGVLTLADRYGLMAALLEESLSDEERAAIDRLCYAVRRGRLQLESQKTPIH